jgi:hypothetical protein
MGKKNLNDYIYFTEIVNYINKIENGDFITRKDLYNNFPISSLDVYRRGMTLIGVLEDCEMGVYKKVRDVPPFINSSNIREYSKDDKLKEKLRLYYLTLERKKKIKEIFDY